MMNVFISREGSFSKELAEGAGGIKGRCLISRFADGEVRIEIEEDLKNKNVFIVQGTAPPVNERCMELFLLLDAVKRLKPGHTTVIMPYCGYSRQDRVTAQGSPVSAELFLSLCRHAGADQVMTLDFHSRRILQIFKGFVQNIHSQPLMAEEWKGSSMPCVCVSPDKGGMERAQNFAQRIGSPTAWIEKERKRPGEARALRLEGNVQGQNVVIIDDIVDTAGTLCTAVDSLIKNGAKDVFVVVAHGLFSGPALERIEKSPIKEVWVTDSIEMRKEILDCRKIKMIPVCARLFSSAVKEMEKKL